MLGISIIRLIHIIKVLRSDKLDVRNSPLDRIASLTARLLFCAKGLCVAGAAGGSITGAGLALDSALINTGNEPIFSPYFVGMLKKFYQAPLKGGGAIKPTTSNTNLTGTEIKAIVKNLDDNQLEQVGLKGINETIFNSNSLSENEKNELENLINQEQLNLKNKPALP
jgi:hypothetical protein